MIHQKDCIEFMRMWRGRKADVVVTSPPYNIGKKYGVYNDNKTTAQYLEWTRTWSGKIADILSDDGSFFCNVGGTGKNPHIPFDVVAVLQDTFVLQNVIHWIKSISIPERGFAAGHFKPINSDMYLSLNHEYVFHLTARGDHKLDKDAVGVSCTDKRGIVRFMHEYRRDVRDRGNVWFVPYETSRAKRSHPAAFPPRLPELCIKLHGVTKDMLVYDPFAGSGSTALACQNLGVDFMGTEIDPAYIDIARQRINNG